MPAQYRHFARRSIKIYRDLDNGHGSGLRSGFKVGIDATFGGSNSKEQKQEEDDALGDRYHHHQHDDYKLQQGDYDLHRYQKSPSITVEIRAREPPEPPDHRAASSQGLLAEADRGSCVAAEAFERRRRSCLIVSMAEKSSETQCNGYPPSG
ncbi:hypothetical protein MRX96_011590 [Rhipicephalus microplus]